MEIVLLIICGVAACIVAGVRLKLRRRAGTPSASRATDVERRMVQAEAALARRLQTDRDRADLLSGLNQEARTSLNAVIGFAELMRLNRASEPLTVRQSQAVDQILAAGAALTALLEEVADLARIEAGQLPMALERVDPRLVARQVCDRLRAQAETAGVRLHAPAPGAGPGLQADRARLRQMLTTLVSAAIDTGRPGDAVHIEVRPNGETVALCVHDTGLGYSPARLAALFQPFGDPAATGVSLAVCRALAEAMNGTIDAVSREGEGSTFTITLPAAATQAVPTAVAPLSRALPAATVLYVEDNPSNVALLRRVLSLMGPQLSLHVAETGHEGLALARDLRPDVILLDINLPGIDGFELRRRLALDPLTEGTPVLALSARALPEDRRKGLEAGFTDYLAKPLDIAALADALGLALAPLVSSSRRAA